MAFANERAHFGITMFPTDYSIQPVELARAVEERGFDSLFFPEHTHIPTSRKTPFPGGGELPKHYSHTHDPFVAFGACAAVTKRIRLGTGICLVIQRDPITLAKEIASVDSLSNGRFVLGIGAGWNREEMSNHGADYANRWRLVREKVLAMKAIWTQDEAEFHGKFVDFDPIWSYPKPAQRGGPPVWIGANSKWVFDRIAEYADGWMPIGGLGSGNLERLKAACEARGRKVEDITLALFGAPTSKETLLGRIGQGFDELIFNLDSEPADAVLPKLDRLANLVASVRKG
ncbi:MAG TPA: LLM class F420-dependent oxidoreductase [Pseudomonadales bacterium]|jgi:probable F420-dependent oxidoreductase|nr:LLM class F420-dependent oxidoreductase [Pseudomonadales bacterium]